MVMAVKMFATSLTYTNRRRSLANILAKQFIKLGNQIRTVRLKNILKYILGLASISQ